MKNKGITLIALIITIIVMLILAGLLTTLSLNLIEQARFAMFKNEMATLDEKVEMEIDNYVLKSNLSPDVEVTLFEEAYSKQSLEELSESLRYEILYARDELPETKVPTAEYYNLEDLELDEDADGNADGLFYVDEETSGKYKAYLYDEKSAATYKIKPTIIFGTELHSSSYGNLIIGNQGLLKNLKESQERIEEAQEEANRVDWVDEGVIPVLAGEYKEQNGVYMCEPDLTGFDATTTYYVTWDSNGNEIMGNTINREAPNEWYNYPSKKWANVVSTANGKIAYWVWIPRYAYKANKTNQTVDIKFVNKQNKCTENGTTTEYSATTPTFDENNIQTNYVVPSSFKWGDSGEISLAGYWANKYEFSSDNLNSITKFNIEKTENSIKITSITGTDLNTSTYEFYINGKRYAGSLPYTFENLKSGKEYTIGVRAKTTGGIYTETEIRKITTLEKLPILTAANPTSLPDISGFDEETTYYVSWDENGNETIGNPINKEAPSNWYDYVNKKWANIVSMANGKVAYWTWIPRYEYKIVDTNIQPDYVEGDTRFYNVYINFISKNKLTPTEGYIIPSSFKWGDSGEIPLAGYWANKYEFSSDNLNNITKFNIEKTENSIKITSITGTSLNTSSYEFYIDGVKTTGSVPYTFNNLTPGTQYSICVRAKTTSGYYTETEVRKITTLQLPTLTVANPPSEPDLSGFDQATTYYVSWDNNGNEVRGNTIAGAAPSNWYDYPNKKWANVVSTANSKTAYWVWIPRYEYKIVDTNLQPDYVEGDTRFYNVYINFINQNTVTPTQGYIIPESFEWGDDANSMVHLKGYWANKYEFSN